MLIWKIIQFIFIFAWGKGAEHWLKGQYVHVPTDSKIILKVLTRFSGEEYLISVEFKHHLSEKKSALCKHVIWPTTVNSASRKLKKINSFYRDVIIDH